LAFLALISTPAGCDGEDGEELSPESSVEACSDGKDNDGDGLVDCHTLNDPETGSHYLADPDCCPMSVDVDGSCVVEDDFCFDPMIDTADACYAAADELGCDL
jgi:hypothetical protein